MERGGGKVAGGGEAGRDAAWQERGGQVRFNAGVRTITTSGGKVTGVVTEDGGVIDEPLRQSQQQNSYSSATPRISISRSSRVSVKTSASRSCAFSITSVLVALVRAYQRLVSPLFPASCRYVPSCSEYAAQALARHGLLRGAWLSVARIVRCNPWSEGGEDPVP